MIREHKTATRLIVTAALLLAGLGFGDTAAAEGVKITGAEYAAAHSGKCIRYSGPTEGTQCFKADGTTSYDDKTWGKDTGFWRVQGNKVCENWNSEPGWDCGPVTKLGKNTYSDGEYTWTIQ